jgi:hypothetical protein
VPEKPEGALSAARTPAQKAPEKAPEKPEAKPAAKDDAAEEAPPNGLTREEFQKVRRDIFRMWHGEPEETR